MKRIDGNWKKKTISITLILALILLILLFFLTIAQSFHNFQTLQQHRAYIHKSGAAGTVQPWMTVPGISHMYNLSQSAVYRILNTTASPINAKRTVATLCSLHKLNCSDAIAQIEALRVSK